MVFVLGVERSATTWVSNILDMHPGTEVYMEPLSINISVLRDWPNRFNKIENSSEKARYFLEELNIIKDRKKFLLGLISDADWAWKIDMNMGKKFWNISSRARDFFELNFHRRGVTGYPPKSKNPLLVFKELRLNYNAPLIKKIDPDAKVVVVVRNYAANVKSIAKQIERGNLLELAALLEKRYGGTSLKNIFDYWSSSYNTLLNDLDDEGINYLLVKQEDLIKSGDETVNQLFNFVSLTPVSSVYNYLEASNTAGNGKHSTNRNHNDIIEENKRAEKELNPVLAEQIKSIEWHPSLREVITRS